MTVVRVKGLKIVRAKGRRYIYHRATGERIDEEPGTPAFFQRLALLEARVAPSASKTKLRYDRGSLGELVERYRASPAYRELAPATRADYDAIFTWLEPMDALQTAAIDSAAVMGIRDRAFKTRKRHFANYAVTVLSLLFNWGKPYKLSPNGNPADGVPKIRRPREMARANRPWEIDEVAVVLGEAEGGVCAAIAIAAMAGLREGDTLRLTWNGYDGHAVRGGQRKTGEDFWVPAHSALKEILRETRRLQVEEHAQRAARAAERGRPPPVASTQIVVNRWGRPFTESGFRASFFKLIGRMIKAGRVRPGLTFHGLRHTLGHFLAELELDDATIAAILGHLSITSSRHYSRSAKRRRQATAAIATLERMEPEFGKPRGTKWKTAVKLDDNPLK